MHRLVLWIGVAWVGCGSPIVVDRLDGAVQQDAGLEAREVGPLGPVDAGRPDGPRLDAEDPDAGTSCDVSTLLDLDDDGIPETAVAVAPCGDALCVDTEGPFVRSVILPNAADTSILAATVYGDALQAIGDHGGTALAELMIARFTADGRPALWIVDIDAGEVLAFVASPEPLLAFESYALAASVGSLLGPGGRSYPFLVPSFGDGDIVSWGYGCLFRAVERGVTACGDGFLQLNTQPDAPGWFREVGTLAQDMDGDGWEDLSLIYHRTLKTISGQTGQMLAETVYDVAAHDEPEAPEWFHSGRNYGTHSVYATPDGVLRHLIVGGAPVGSFTDAGCNVSRFVASLATDDLVPASRHLSFSHYFGFASSIFREYSPAFADNPEADLVRRGDFVDGCIHRFEDSRTVIDGAEAVLINDFRAGPSLNPCLWEQYQLYLPPTWTDAKADAWYSCAAANVGTLGHWGMTAYRAQDGMSVTGGTDVYVWGWTDQLLSSGETVYLVERLEGEVRFDLGDRAASPLVVYAIVEGLFVERGVLPIDGRPKIRPSPSRPDISSGGSAGPVGLSLRDHDCDGLMELELEDGRWIGHDGTRFVVVEG